MKSIMMRDSSVLLEDTPMPEPGPGQVLVKSLACGICGSDIHLVRHSRDIFEFYREIGVIPPESDAQGLEINLGHEFCAEIVSFGPGTRQQLNAGDRVTAVPMLLTDQGQLATGLPTKYSSGAVFRPIVSFVCVSLRLKGAGDASGVNRQGRTGWTRRPPSVTWR